MLENTLSLRAKVKILSKAIVSIKDNSFAFSIPWIRLPFGYVVRIEGRKTTNNPHAPGEAVENDYRTGAYLCRKSCRPIVYLKRLK